MNDVLHTASKKKVDKNKSKRINIFEIGVVITKKKKKVMDL